MSKEKSQQIKVNITAPNMQTAAIRIVGTSPYVQNKFSEKARAILHGQHAAGSQNKKGAKKEPKDFQACFEAAQYRAVNGGWNGIPASCFRAASISACRLVGFKMTLAKLSVFVEADGYDADGTPLVRFTKGKPRYHEGVVRNATGVIDLRARPMWEPGWEAVVRIRYDGDQFSVQDVMNLLSRVGEQIGIGEGRHDSRESCGCGWGLFTLEQSKK